jgi:hypothetical protein
MTNSSKKNLTPNLMIRKIKENEYHVVRPLTSKPSNNEDWAKLGRKYTNQEIAFFYHNESRNKDREIYFENEAIRVEVSKLSLIRHSLPYSHPKKQTLEDTVI